MFSIGLLLLTEILYRFMDVPGYNQTYVNQYNFGNYMDMVLMGKINRGGWVAINCIPTAVHTIAGALVGKFLMSKQPEKTKQLLIWGTACLLIGYGLDLAGITPIIKRIATSSFTIASLGWCVLGLTACYYFVDVKGNKKGLTFFNVLGMNSIFIYLFFEIVGGKWFNGYISTIAEGLFHRFIAENGIGIISSLTIFFIEWKLCEFLYKKKIFFKL
jgi:predicted acyltransferase